MADTLIGINDPKAVKRWSTSLFLDYNMRGFWNRKFTSTSPNSVVQKLNELESQAGDTIKYDLNLQLRNKPTRGDNPIEQRTESLQFYQDEISIDQLRHGTNPGGRMTRKRTIHNLRKICRDRLSEYWSKYMDELHFMFLSGARGINEDFTEDTAFTGINGNNLLAPDADHILYGGSASSKATIQAADKMNRVLIERAETYAKMIRATNRNNANMQQLDIQGGMHFACVMSTYQEHDMRTADTTGWLDIMKAAAGAEGRNNPIFKGSLGMLKNVILHSHENVIRFNDYGAGANVEAARALFLGRQAGVVAYGTSGKQRFIWSEKEFDHGNSMEVVAGLIFGLKKCRFNSRDFGVIALDTAAASVN